MRTTADTTAIMPTGMSMADVDLGHHGDREVAPGLLDFAVNVRLATPPRWLRDRLVAGLDDLAAYPDPAAATAAVAARHHRDPSDVLLTSGAAEAFVLLARTLRPRRAVVVHPQFTEPEAALRAAGHEVERVILGGDFTLDPDLVPEGADLVVVGNPTNPTSVLHPAAVLAGLARPGRILVVDEAFMDAIPGESGSLAGRADVPGLVVIRSLTKTWGLAGLRVGYLLADPVTVGILTEAQPLWSVSSLALIAAQACSEPEAIAEAAGHAAQAAEDRDHLVQSLTALAGVTIPAMSEAPFVLLHVPGAAALRTALRARGIAVRRGDTFPGLGPDWLRIAVRDRAATDRLTELISQISQNSPTATQRDYVTNVS
jgi:histidinol-phosphate aminotransferase